MPVGRPFPVGNKLGRGRPKGSRNKKTLVAQELLENYSAAIMRDAIAKARARDAPTQRYLLSLIVPRRKDLPVKFGRLPMRNAQELCSSSEKLMKKVATGKISVAEASGLTELMEQRRRIIETSLRETRLCAIEERAKDKTKDDTQPD